MYIRSRFKSSVRRWFALAIATALFVGGGLKAHAFTHPGIPLTVADLDNVKSNLVNAPWSEGYAALLADGKSSTTYTMAGPFGYVNRNYYGNYDHLGAWENDMQAIFNLSRMWYFTGDGNYAKKSHDILLAWANTMTNFNGNEGSLDLGDYAYRYGVGADILRGTWPGWTAADTLAVSNLFANVYLPRTYVNTNISTLGPANKGALSLAGALVVAVFNDDTNLFNHILYLYQTTASCGVHNNSLTSGEMDETGRDQGHSYNYLLQMAFCAEVFYKQGIDVYSEEDNRLLADGEYYARNNIPPTTTFIPFGTIDAYYLANASDGLYISEPMMGNILRSAYVDEFRIYSGALSAGEVAMLVTPLAALTNLNATAGNGQATLSWSAVANANSYQIFRSPTNGGPYTQIAAVTTISFINTGLLNGTNYFYVVKAVNTVGTSGNSLQVSARPVSTTAPQVSYTASSTQMQIGWPADHIGWRLQTQTNSLVTNGWFDVPNSTLTNVVSIPISDQSPISVFFRLVYL